MPFAALPPQPPAHAAKPASTLVVGLRPKLHGDGYQLLRLRSRTLRAARKPIDVPDTDPAGIAVAPDGRRVAMATETSGFGDPTKARITVATVRAWKRSRTIEVPADLGEVRGVRWSKPDRLLVFGADAAGGSTRLVVLDPTTGQAVTPIRDLGDVTTPRASGDRTVLTGGSDDARSNEVLVLDADGNDAFRLEVGDLSSPVDRDRPETVLPSWTVDPTSGHLLGLAATTPVLVDVDPVAGTITPKGMITPGPREWIDGAVDSRRLVFRIPGRGDRSEVVPVDRDTLTAGRSFRVTGFNPPEGAGNLVIVPSSSLSSSSLKGLRAYGLDGRRRWTAEPGHRTTTGRRFGGVIYADVQGVNSTVLSAKTGKTLRRGPRRSLQIFDPRPSDGFQPWFGFGGLR